jgi:ACS family pantothenate transporter-like MFS transporter
MNEMAYVLQAWLPLLIWQQVEAPKYRKGFVTVTFLSAALIATALIIRVLHARELARGSKDRETGQFHQSSDSEEETAGKSVATDLDGKPQFI